MIRWSKGLSAICLFFICFTLHGQGFNVLELEVLLNSDLSTFEKHIINLGYSSNEESSDIPSIYFYTDSFLNHVSKQTSKGTVVYSTVNETIYLGFIEALPEAGYILIAEDSAEAFTQKLWTKDYISPTGRYIAAISRRENGTNVWFTIRLAYPE